MSDTSFPLLRRIEKWQQLLVPRPRERRQLERIEQDASAAARIANQKPRSVAALVNIYFDRRKFTR